MRYRFGELFSGPGGLGFAAKRSRIKHKRESHYIEHVWANDVDPDSCATYKRNISPDNPDSVVNSAVEDLDISSLPPIDAFAYGFPCNDFSIVGEQNGFSGEYGPLYTFGVDVLNHHNPKWFLAENVGGLRSANDGLAFKRILSELSGAGDEGYSLAVHLYKFEEYGVPQTRHRIIVVGIRNDLGLDFRVPAPTTPDRSNQISARKAIEDPPIPSDSANNEPTKHAAAVIERLTHIPPGKNAWYEGIPDHLKLNVKTVRLSQIYRRLDPDKPAYTVTGSGGGGTHVYHWKENRALTNRERARLQTFPDDFIFEGGKESVRKQIGMAVPPAGAQVIVEAVLKTLAGLKYESIDPKWGETSSRQRVQLPLELGE